MLEYHCNGIYRIWTFFCVSLTNPNSRRAEVENLAVSGSYNHQIQQLPKIRRLGVYESQCQHFSTETAHNQETLLPAHAAAKVYTSIWSI